MCCSVLQCVAVCCSVLQCVEWLSVSSIYYVMTKHISLLQCVAVRYGVVRRRTQRRKAKNECDERISHDAFVFTYAYICIYVYICISMYMYTHLYIYITRCQAHD